MAEQRRVRADGGRAATDPPPLTAAEVGRDAMRQIAELTGKEPEGATGVEPTDDGWLVTIEVVETRRIPAAADLLASYETEIGPDGELVSYRRARQYARGRGDSFKDNA
jgi:hypothetical protein